MTVSELVRFQSNNVRLKEIKKNRQNIIPFVGAGVSKSCGFYTWGELLDKISADYLSPWEITILKKSGNYFKYADRIVKAAGNTNVIMRRISELFSDLQKTPNELPYLLVSTFSKMIITTNYDTLLENASKVSSLGALRPLLPCLEGQMTEAIQINDRRLLKIHGSVEESSSFVFTSEQYEHFYGTRYHRDNCLIPRYLKKIFLGKKVLFVGCSLDQDRTLDILKECVKKDENISHYAITPYSNSKIKQIIQARKLSSLGIIPVYYPKGDYEAVNKIISYIAEENKFISSVKNIILSIVGDDFAVKEQVDTIITILKESFFYTSDQYPDLLDINETKASFYVDILNYIKKTRQQDDTLLNIVLEMFNAYVNMGYMPKKENVIYCFSEYFKDKAVKEIQIESLLEKRWRIDRIIEKFKKVDLALSQIDSSALNEYAQDLLGKLQYKNGMNFVNIGPAYNQAKMLIDNVPEKMSLDNRLKLLNAIGAFGPYFGEAKKATDYLEKCIADIEKLGDLSKEDKLFEAKCYANLAIARSLSNYDVYSVIEAAEKDIKLKQQNGESDLLYSRSLNFYATILKELDPFKACDKYLEVCGIKKEIILKSLDVDESSKIELTASWATSVFNLGLLAKDVELYDLAHEIVAIANDYRFKNVDYCNRDYCSSINVMTELELFAHKKCNVEALIKSLESRVDLPIGFSETKAHTWYVFAVYYYQKKEYATAKKYANKAIESGSKEDSLVDFRLEIRTKLLIADIIYATSGDDELIRKRSIDIYQEVIDNIEHQYGENSFYLITPFLHIIDALPDSKEKSYFICRYKQLNSKYSPLVFEMEEKLKKYIHIIKDC